MEPNKEYARFTRQVGYVLSANIIGALLGLIQFPILTKGLGATLYGAWSLIGATISLIVPFAVLGFGEGIIRFLAAEKDKGRIREDFLSTLFFTVFISGAAFSLLLFLFSDYLAASIFNDINSSLYIKLASIMVLLGCISGITSSYLRTFRKIGLLSTFTVAQIAVSIGLIVISLLLGYKLTGVIIATIVASLLFHFTLVFIILKEIGFQFPRFSHLKSFLRYGLPLTPTNAILWIISSSDRYMISYFIGVTAAGIYSAAYTISWYATFLATPIAFLLFPTITKSYDEENLSETRNYLRYSFKYYMMIAIPAAFGLSILAKPILQTLTTSEFVAGSTVVPLVAFSAVLSGFYGITIFIIHLVKKTNLVFILLSASAVLNIVFNIILIPRMGILGAAVATLIAYVILSVLVLIVTRRYLKFDISMPFMLKSVFSSLVMTLCVWLISPESTALVIVSILVGILVYFGVLLLIRGLSKEEVAFFVNFLKDSLRKVRVIR